jgi:HAD superfamily hydrolase (TIGR01509 family)
MDMAPPVDWTQIDTVLLDMDGTLLDLGFDTWFWLERIPAEYGAANGMTAAEAWEAIKPEFLARRGTIQWYCLDHWSDFLRLNVAEIKRAALHRVGYLPGAEDFLQRLARSGKRRVLVTNAHPAALALKNERVGLMTYFDACHSSHAFDAPKESLEFWTRLRRAEPFDPARTLFVDDSLPVLDAAHRFGIAWLRAIRRPDPGRPGQDMAPYAAVDRVADLM